MPCVNTEAGGDVIPFELVTATCAEQVGGSNGAEAVSAAGSELIVALRAEVEVALHMGPACGTCGDEGSAEEEVEYGANSTGHDEADQHPEPGTHRASGSILADVADHQDVERGEKAPGDVEVGAEAQGDLMVLGSGEDDPEVVLNKNENRSGTDDGPDRHQPGVFVRVDRFRFAHGLYSLIRGARSSHRAECY